MVEKCFWLSERVSDQTRPSGEPYITHPLQVATMLVDWGMDIDSVIAGVLHDTVEDTDATLEEITELFGRDIAFLVDGVTKVSQARAGMKNLESYLPSTTDNLTKLLIAVGQDVRVIIIKLADRLHNMQTLQFKSPEKQKKIARETLDVFAPLADRLNMGRLRVQLEELSFKYLMPEEYNQTVTRASGIAPEAMEFTEELRAACQSLARQLIADAEGASHDIDITVVHASSEAAGEAVARAVARSNLFKAAVFGKTLS